MITPGQVTLKLAKDQAVQAALAGRKWHYVAQASSPRDLVGVGTPPRFPPARLAAGPVRLLATSGPGRRSVPIRSSSRADIVKLVENPLIFSN